MNRIATKVETRPDSMPASSTRSAREPEATGADAISLAAREIAETLKLSAIVTYTASGTTGLRAARERPQVPIIALSPILNTARRLSLLWGTHCVVSPDAADLDDMVDRACRIALRGEFRQAGRPHHHHRRRAAAGRRARPTCCASPISASERGFGRPPSAARLTPAKAPRQASSRRRRFRRRSGRRRSGPRRPAPSPAGRARCPPSFSIAATTRSGAIQSGLWPRFRTQTSSAPGISRARPSEWISS